MSTKSLKILEEIQINAKDCGSTAVQIYHLSKQIDQINEHLKINPKDFAAKRGSIVLIGKRMKLCKYFKSKHSLQQYEEIIIGKIGLRK